MLTFTSPSVTEIAPDMFRISLHARELNLQFNFFLVRDEQPLLFTTGFRATFPSLREAVAWVIDPARLHWVGFSHFESDECGALNLWLEAAPHAEPMCGLVAAAVNVNDFAAHAPKGMADDEALDTGKYLGSASARPRSCRTAGTLASCSRRPNGPCSVRTCSSRAGTWRRSQKMT